MGLLDLLVLVTAWTHVILAPYTKVEESFNTHATHDVLMYGVGQLAQYDHYTFPGAVPRTFVGSVSLAWISTPAIFIATKLGLVHSKFHLQIIVRLVLATLNAIGICFLRRAVSRRFGHNSGVFFALLTCSQFHLPFWMGRTLPNMFALLPVNISTALLVGHNSARQPKRVYKMSIALLTFAAVVFRAELALLLVPLVVQIFVTRKLSLSEMVKVGFSSGLSSIALTTVVDSYFWKTFPTWPELHGIYFNVIQGKSSEWGVSPPLTYVKSYLPKLLLSGLPLSFIGAIVDRRVISMLFPSISFIVLISLLGHKEWRFIIYVVPVFNIAAGRGAAYLCTRKPIFLRKMLILATTFVIGMNVLVTMIFTLASMWNYPGGEAISLFHKLYTTNNNPTPHIHISNLAAQTGASLFLHLNARPYHIYEQSFSQSWAYNKTEHLDEVDLAKSNFTHLITETLPSERILDVFVPVASIRSFDRWVLDRGMLSRLKDGLVKRPWDITKVLRMEKSTKLWILERKNR